MSDPVRALIANWVAWCWQGRMPGPAPVGCGSAEKHWRAPDANSEEPSRTSLRVVNVDAAERVQALWESLDCVSRVCVQYEYPRKREFDRLERRQEVHQGALRWTWEVVANRRREAACHALGISEARYWQAVDAFGAMVAVEFAGEVAT